MSEVSPEDREACLRMLQAIADDPSLAAEDERFQGLVAKVNRAARKQKRKEQAEKNRSHDRKVLAGTLRVRAEGGEVEDAPVAPILNRSQPCYICKEAYREVDERYHLLCPACALESEARRQPKADLHGRVALLTGGRIKIGFQTGLFLLRNGAILHVTTRFPRSARDAYEAEEGYCEWQDRLHIHALDLRDVPRVEPFAYELSESERHLDILINNAAQTIKRPLAYYRSLLAAEGGETPLLEARLQNLPMPEETLALFPEGLVTAEGQPVDLRTQNSWRTSLSEVETAELLEVHLVNALSPCLLVARLKEMLERSSFDHRFVVNVSAMEGQFSWKNKTTRHPHTNMAKAALNMLTRTSAAEYAESGIYMNSVDTGWVTEENPYPVAEAQRAKGFVPPLDVVDGAARVVAPIFDGVNCGEPLFGQFLKDYRPYPW